MCATYFSQKVLAPILPSTIVHRDSLIQTLGNALPSIADERRIALVSPYKLVLLCAPVGYGKTTLLADTIQRQGIHCCWYFLDRTDTDTAVFLHILLASIRHTLPQFAPHLDTLLSQAMGTEGNSLTMPPCFASVIDALIEALAELPHPLVLALCNYHDVNSNETINSLLNRLLVGLPRHCVLVIESRALPHLELAALIARGQMFGLGSQGLRFSKEDLLELARLQHLAPLSDEEAERLTTSFDGWIAGILLGSRLGRMQFHNPLQSGGKQWGAIAIQNSRQQLFTYVVNEIFQHEQDTYTFLKETSILEHMTPDLCNALLDTTDAEARLIYAEQQGLFVMSMGEDENLIYSCHPVLRDLLVEDLRASMPERYRSLHRKTALLLQQAHDYDQAYTHAIQAQDYDLATQILLDAAPPMITQGHAETVARWLHMLPPDIMEAHPQLLLMHVNIHLMGGQYALAQPLLDKIDALFQQAANLSASVPQPRLQAEWLLARSTLLLYQGQHQQAQTQCQQALALLPVDERVLRIQAYQRLGICLIVGGGRVHEGIAQLQQALQLCGPFTEERQTALLHNQLANAYSWVGNYAISEHHRARAIRIWERLGRPWGIINNLTGMGQLKTRQGFHKEAEEIYQKALALSRDSSKFQSGEAYALLGLGELYLDQQRYGQALSHLEDSLSLARQLKDRYLITCGQCALATTYLQMGDPHTARYLLDQMVPKVEEVHGYESILYMLTLGAISFALGQFQDARSQLTVAEEAAHNAGIQRLQLQAILRLAVCELEQGEKSRAKQQMRRAIELNQKGDHDHCLHIELQHYPRLQQLLPTQYEGESIDQPAEKAIQVSPARPPQSPANIGAQQQNLVSALPATPRLRILALGEPVVLLDDMPVIRWRMARAMELYFFLLEKGQPLRKEQIITALWPDATDQIDQTLRSTFYYLRKAIGEACVVYRSGLYSLDVRKSYGDYTYDVAEFETYRQQAKEALAASDDAIASVALNAMMALYRGDYVQSFYSDWCTFRRDELRRASMEARRQLALLAWRQEQWDESLDHWQHLLALDECLETAHYGVMRCYMRQGKRDLALRQFQRCTLILQEQLMVAPGPSLQKLYQRLLAAE